MYTDDKRLAKESTALNIHNGHSLVVNGTAEDSPDVDSQVSSDSGKDNISSYIAEIYAEILLFYTGAALVLLSIYE